MSRAVATAMGVALLTALLAGCGPAPAAGDLTGLEHEVDTIARDLDAQAE